MNLKRGLALATAMVIATAGGAMASGLPGAVGLTPLGAWRGTMDRADLSSLVRELGSVHQKDRTDLLVVRASLAANTGSTSWHGHTGPSIVIVTAGAMTVSEATPSGGCATATYGVGEAFFHPEGAHNFENDTTSAVEFLVAYFVPAGSVITHPPAPAC